MAGNVYSIKIIKKIPAKRWNAMNRMKELENAVKKYWEERTEKKRSYLEQHYEEMKPELQKKLKWLLDDQKNKEKDGGHRHHFSYLPGVVPIRSR